jgi:hypothetical protein
MPYQASLMFVSKAGLCQVKHLFDARLKDRLLALPTNIRLGCTSLSGTSSLAYYENPLNTDVKSFITLASVIESTKISPFTDNQISITGPVQVRSLV